MNFGVLPVLNTALLAAVLSACAGAPPPAPAQSAAPSRYEPFDNSNFLRSTRIDNPWFPLEPGMRFTWEGNTVEDGETLPHRVVFTVTDLVKQIDGVASVVAWDQDFSDGELVETELTFFAQDDDGTIWRMGEHPEEYEDGKFVEAPTWIHGVGDGRAGIMMEARPALGTPSYSQGWSPAVEFTDRGFTYQMGEKTCVPAGCYEDVLVIDESAADEPEAHQLKYYARGVGNVRVGWRGDEEVQENLELVKVETLGPEELAKVRAAALAIEAHAYQISPDVYGRTAPSKPSGMEQIATD